MVFHVKIYASYRLHPKDSDCTKTRSGYYAGVGASLLLAGPRMMRNRLLRFVSAVKRLVLQDDSPKFEPEVWNTETDVQYENNCYNYACNIQGTYAQPGLSAGRKYDNLSCDEISQAAAADGLVPIDCNNDCGRGSHKVALAISPGKTFHWYRLDRNGYWSHKLGDGPATNLDSSRKLITDPRTADRGEFTTFCGCFCVRRSKASIR